MAIKNNDGNYLKVDIERSRLPDFVAVDLYKSEDLRQEGPGPFDAVCQECLYCQAELIEELDSSADSEKSVWENVITACYKALKRMVRFQHWEDC